MTEQVSTLTERVSTLESFKVDVDEDGDASIRD
jgi:hypothetical protein